MPEKFTYRSLVDNTTPVDSPVTSSVSPQRVEELKQSGALLLRYPDQSLTPEQAFYLNVLQTGRLFTMPIKPQELRESDIDISVPKSIGKLPNSMLNAKWRSEQMVDRSILESPTQIADTINRVRGEDFSDRMYKDETVGHLWDANYTGEKIVDTHFGYLERRIHVRRVEMLADLAVLGIKEAVEEKGEAKVVDIGSGIFVLEKSIISKLTSEQRRKVTFVGVDISEDLLRYGLTKGYIDQAVNVDMSQKTGEDYDTLFPDTDVAIFSEILEHIPHVGAQLNETAAPWLKKNQAFLLGSVPNPVKLVEYLPLLTGTGSSTVLRRPIFDATNDHYSHLTVATLAELLDNWGFPESGIVSNAVPLDSKAFACDLYAGLDYPGFGLNLLFWGRQKEQLQKDNI